MSKIPRELFVPKASRGIAYVDEDIPVAKGRYLIEPMVIARLLQEARVKPTDIVLDVGAGTGYASALLSRLAATVVALESDAELAARAMRRCANWVSIMWCWCRGRLSRLRQAGSL